ncbi:MAG: GPR endopeptidase [Ruminococcaceae bacterium]|nr:GPR endopeptidase [Oscillospiraceae bacterium]
MENFDFFTLKTDLADENDEILRTRTPNLCGIETKKSTINGAEIFEMNVKDEKGEELTGKNKGRYITVNVGRTEFFDSTTFERVCGVLAGCMSSFTEICDGAILLAGLGNPAIYADSVGTQTAENFIVTRHIKQSSPELFNKFSFRETCAVLPNVFGNTGVEAAQMIKGVVDDVHPSCIIAVDSLSSRRLSRLCTTVQLCDTGICPGSGVGNVRAEISKKTMGVPVIAIGVPTVVNAGTLARDLLSECGVEKNQLSDEMRKMLARQIGDDCYVSPKNCEKDVKSISRLIGFSLNAAIHKGIEFSQMHDFL